MKITKFFFLITLILTGLSFSSCSDDDDDDNSSNNFGTGNVFTGGLPKYIGESALKYNAEGLLEEISSEREKVTFEYSSKAKSTNNNKIVVMKVVYLKHEKDNYSIKMEIGDNGFVSNALQTYADNLVDTWEFKYNSDGQLNYMKRSEGGNEVTNITYTNGNITSVKMQSDDAEEGIYTSKTTYVSDIHIKGIENKGCLMFFDQTFGIDMDEMDYAYYAGLLGRATKNLPLNMTDYDDDSYAFDWTINDKGYPTKFSYPDGSQINTVDFKW